MNGNQNLTGPTPSTPYSRPYEAESESSEASVFAPESSQEISVDSLVYEGFDSISAIIDLNLQSTVRNIYDASAQVANLPPPDPEGETGPQPYETSARKLIKKFYSDRILTLLAKTGLSPDQIQIIYKAMMTGQPIDSPELAQVAEKINQQATKETREQGRLPDSWTIDSNVKEDWVPAPIVPYDTEKQNEIRQYYYKVFDSAISDYASKQTPKLTDKEIELIQLALKTGEVSPEIAVAFKEISEIANKKVIEVYSLPNSWSPEKTEAEYWQPVNLGIVTPNSLNQARQQMIMDNLIQLVDTIEKAVVKTRDGLGKNSIHRVALQDYIEVIASAIRELKKVLQDMEIKDAEKNREITELKFDRIKEMEADRKKQMDEQRKAREKQEKSNKVAKVMGILGPCIAVITAVVGVGLAWATGGATLYAAIIVSSIMLSYSIADSQMGLTQKAMVAFNDFLADKFDDPMIRSLVKSAMVAALVALLTILLFVGNAGAATSVATAAAKQTVSTTAAMALKQMSTQTIMMAIMTSNVIPEVFSNTLIKAGAFGSDDTKAKFISEMVMMAFVMTVTIIASPSAGQQKADVAAKTTMEKVRDLGRAIEQFAIDVKNFTKDVCNKIIEMVRELLKMLENAKQFLKELPERCIERIREGYRILQQAAAADTLEESYEILRPALEAIKQEMVSVVLSSQTALNRFDEAAGKHLTTAVEDLKKILNEVASMIGLTALKTIKDQGLKKSLMYLVSDQGRVELLSWLQSFFKNVGISMQATNGIIQGTLSLKLRNILEELGKIEYSIEILQALIKVLEQVKADIMSGLDMTTDWMSQLDQDHTNLYQSKSRIANQLFQARQG